MYLAMRIALVVAAAMCLATVVLHLTLLSLMYEPGQWRSFVDMAWLLLGLVGVWDCWRASAALERHLDAHARSLSRPGCLVVFPDWGDPVAILVMLTLLFGTMSWYFGLAYGPWVGWPMALVGASVVAFALRDLWPYPVDGRPVLVMDGRGFEHAWLGSIDWPRIQRTALARVIRRKDDPPSPMLRLATEDAAMLRARIPAARRAPAGANGADEVLLPLIFLKARATDIADFAERRRIDAGAGATAAPALVASRLRPPPPLPGKLRLSVWIAATVASLGSARLLWLYWVVG